MTRRAWRLLWLIIGAGLLARVAWAFATVGQAYDIENLRRAGDTFVHHPFGVYEALNTGGKAGVFVLYGWPYPPGLLPYAALAVEASKLLDLPFHGVVQLLPIAADGAIAWLVQDFLGRRGASDATRLGAAALVALGPSFAVISGYHGQIDAVAILPAVAALWLWERSESPHRGLWAGLLIGLGASVKTIPLVMVLALLPSARTLREGVWLAVAAAGLPLLAAAPFVIAEGRSAVDPLRYAGAPGLGGISMFVQPGIVDSFLTNDFGLRLSGATNALYDRASLVLGAGMAGLAAFFAWRRPRATEAAVLVWLVVYVFNPNWFPQYMVWGLPFFLMAGYLGRVAVIELALVPILILFYDKPWSSDWVAVLYVGIMAALWLGWAAWLASAGTRLIRRPPAPARADALAA